MTELPFLDEHTVATDAEPGRVWDALVRFLRDELAGGLTPLFARLVDCDSTSTSPGFEGLAGQAIPGFRVTQSEPGRRLELEGEHHFARYQLGFRIDPDGSLHATSRGAFPGLRGGAYRALVIASGGHRILTRGMLQRIAHLARSRRAAGTFPDNDLHPGDGKPARGR